MQVKKLVSSLPTPLIILATALASQRPISFVNAPDKAGNVCGTTKHGGAQLPSRAWVGLRAFPRPWTVGSVHRRTRQPGLVLQGIT